MINIGAISKVMGAKAEFEKNHPKFAALLGTIISGNMVEEGSVIEVTVTKPDGTKVEGNMKVLAEDLALIEQMKSLGM